LLNGLYDAKLDHQPVVAIVGQQALAAIGGSYQQEVALKTLFTDVARYSAFAELLGLDGILVQRPEEIAPAWEKALTASRPTLIEAITDPNGPPLPPHITFKNAKAYASALLKGDPDAAGIIKQSLKELVA
jgi:thiamine pyrophosphate-dependent acetolactate synthase large subunit-like protein